MEITLSENYRVIQVKATRHESAAMNYSAVNDVDEVLKAIDHDLRRQIISLLEEKKRIKVADIYQKLDVDQSAVSLHLAILRRNNIVKAERSGRMIFYSLNYCRIAEVIAFISKMTLADHSNNN